MCAFLLKQLNPNSNYYERMHTCIQMVVLLSGYVAGNMNFKLLLLVQAG